MIDVTTIGDINIDIISSPIKTYPKKEQQTILPDVIVQLGGSSAIFASACSRFGMKTKFIGRLGYDIFSDFLLEEMKRANVKTEIRRVKREKVGITISLTFEDMKRAMITFRGSNANLSKKDFEIRQIEGNLLHIGGFNLLDNLRKDVHKIFNYAKKKGMKTSLDPNWDPKGWTEKRLKNLEKVLEVTDFFFPDYEEGKAITMLKQPEKIVRNLVNLGPEIVGLKCGKTGCYVGNRSEIVYVKGFKVKSIQSTGAGDVFDAAFIKAYLSGLSLKDCGTFANAAGALSTTNFGLERFLSEEKIIRFLKT